MIDSLREMFAMMELELRRLRHDRTEIITPGVFLQSTIFVSVFYGLTIGVDFVFNPLYFIMAILIIFFVSGGFAAISILIASIMKTRERFMGIGQALIMPLFFVSNSLYPVNLMPPILQYFAFFNPLTYAVDAYRIITQHMVKILQYRRKT